MATPAFFMVSRTRSGIISREADDIDVGDTGVTALGLTFGPAHYLDAVVTVERGEGRHFCEREIGQDGADKSKFHHPAQYATGVRS